MTQHALISAVNTLLRSSLGHTTTVPCRLHASNLTPHSMFMVMACPCKPASQPCHVMWMGTGSCRVHGQHPMSHQPLASCPPASLQHLCTRAGTHNACMASTCHSGHNQGACSWAPELSNLTRLLQPCWRLQHCSTGSKHKPCTTHRHRQVQATPHAGHKRHAYYLSST